MPSFGRLSKHSNRSQHALPEQQSTATGSGSASGSVSGSAAAGAPSGAAQTAGSGTGGAASGPGAAAQAESPAEAAPQSALSSTAALSSSDVDTFVDARLPPQGHPLQQQQLLQQHQQHQLQQHLHQQQQPPAPPPHLFNSQSAGVNPLPPLQTGGGVPTFEGHQPQTPIDFADAAVNRSQSQRYGAPLLQPQHQQQQQQQQQAYPIASGSFDDLPSAGSYQQQHPPLQQQSIPAPAPQKRSTRKLIKGIFGSSRDSHEAAHQQQIQQQQLLLQQHHQQQLQQQQQQQQQHQATGPYDNTTGLARRPSKRVSNNPPNLKSSSSQANRQAPDWDWDWQAHGPQSQQPSPLREVGDEDEHSPYQAHNSNVDSPLQDSRILLNNNSSIRQLSTEHLEATSPYDDVDYQPPDHPPPHQQPHHQLQGGQQQPPPPPLQHPQPLQRQGTLRVPDQQIQYDSQQHQQQSQTPDYDTQSPQARSQGFHYPSKSPQPPGQFPLGEEPRIVTSQLGPNVQLQNPETVSQLSHDSPVTDSDPRSNIQPPPSVNTSSAAHHAATLSLDTSGNAPKPSQIQPADAQSQEQSAMAPPAPGGGPQSSRRGQESEKASRNDPGYRQGSISLSPMPPAPGQPGGQNPAYRGDRQFDASPGVEQGRNSPQPSDRDPELEKQFKDLLTKYKNVKRLYFDGKSQIETLNGQVEQLQNAVANQRMSQSRTAWDDNEYSTRFNRLNGAINNLSFNIRKDWRSLPPWLDGFVSADALKTGKQEMTAVGRAVVSRWLVEDVFNQCFHPALDTQLSAHLKEIELSIRGNAHTMHSQEEYDALTTKVVNWRMATLDGLQKKLSSSSAAENRGMLAEKLTTNLTAYLYQYLTTPPPPGVEGSTSMIAELAVAIAANLPLESRDVAITYPLPGDVVHTHIMEVEKAGLPVLEGQKGDADADSDSDDDEPEDKDNNGKSRGKSGRLTKKRPDATTQPSRGGAGLSSAQATVTDRESHPALPKDSGRVRFAGFVALEVRGRQVLMKAPVWTL